MGRFQTATLSAAGPRAINEDAYATAHLGDGSLLAAVADGLGGRLAGEVASRLAVEDAMAWQGGTWPELHDHILALNHHLFAEQAKDLTKVDMATTLTMVVFQQDHLYGAHCGDSRLTRIRDGEIVNISHDHTEVQNLLDAGAIDEAQALVYPRKHILEEALGTSRNPRIDHLTGNILPGDRFLLTTDGVHDRLRPRQLHEVSALSPTPEDFCRHLQESLEILGPTDNYTAICVDVAE